MPGAWEAESKSVVCAILHTDMVTMAWAFGLRNLQLPGIFMPLAGMPFDHARNLACQKALDLGASHIFFLDSDVVPPHNAVIKLLAHNRPIIGGMYCRRSPPHAVPVMMKGGKWITEFVPDSIVEVDVTGAGCLLIETELLKKVPAQRPDAGKHWFDWRVDCSAHPPAMSEDFTFNLWVKHKLGISTFVDTSIKCKHIGLAQADYGSFVPCEVNPGV